MMLSDAVPYSNTGCFVLIPRKAQVTFVRVADANALRLVDRVQHKVLRCWCAALSCREPGRRARESVWDTAGTVIAVGLSATNA